MNFQQIFCAAALVSFAGVAACGSQGSGSSGSPTAPSSSSTGTTTTAGTGNTTFASLGYRFTLDEGARVSGNFIAEPNYLQIPGATLLYLACCGGAEVNSVLTSTDGLNFTRRSATVPGVIQSQSFVRLPDGNYRMYYAYSQVRTELRSALSSDGLRWTEEAGVRYTFSRGGVPFVAAMGGGYRLYYVEGTTYSAFSTDGLNFTREGVRFTTSMNIADPSVTEVPGEGYIMTASDFASNTTNGFARLWLARSPDGLTWTIDAQPIVAETGFSLVDPSALLPIGGGRYRFYYSRYPGRAIDEAPGDIRSGVISKD